MRLQKRLSRIVAGKEYVKWVITIPPSNIKKLGWREGEELEAVIKNNKLIIKPKKK